MRSGSAAQPGTGARYRSAARSRDPGVYEIALGSPLARRRAPRGRPAERPRALLVGGYGGTWLDARRIGRPRAQRRRSAPEAPARSGPASLWLLGEGTCGVQESARVLDCLAAESAGQCGPCLFGLRAIADTFDRVAAAPRARRS